MIISSVAVMQLKHLGFTAHGCGHMSIPCANLPAVLVRGWVWVAGASPGQSEACQAAAVQPSPHADSEGPSVKHGEVKWLVATGLAMMPSPTCV